MCRRQPHALSVHKRSPARAHALGRSDPGKEKLGANPGEYWRLPMTAPAKFLNSFLPSATNVARLSSCLHCFDQMLMTYTSSVSACCQASWGIVGQVQDTSKCGAVVKDKRNRTVEAGRWLRQLAVQKGGLCRIQRCTHRLKVPGCFNMDHSQAACRMQNFVILQSSTDQICITFASTSLSRGPCTIGTMHNEMAYRDMLMRCRGHASKAIHVASHCSPVG